MLPGTTSGIVLQFDRRKQKLSIFLCTYLSRNILPGVDLAKKLDIENIQELRKICMNINLLKFGQLLSAKTASSGLKDNQYGKSIFYSVRCWNYVKWSEYG